MSLSDRELISLLQEGKAEAIEALYNRYARLVYSIAFKILQNHSDAEELTQNIFMSLWEKRNYDPKRGSLKSFLGLLTRSRSIDLIRKRNTAQKLIEKWQKHIAQNSYINLSLEELENDEKRKKILKALTLLPLEEKEVLMLNFFEGLSRNQIAKKLNLSRNTVKNRVRSAFVKLKRILFEEVN